MKTKENKPNRYLDSILPIEVEKHCTKPPYWCYSIIIFLLITIGLFIFSLKQQSQPVEIKIETEELLDEENELGTYRITGYYKPLPNQSFYATGSYKNDLKLNCWRKCEITTSGKKPEWGMAACPPQLEDGVKILIKGLAEFTCEDRGEAIKGNRIDIFTGEGEEGLKKALDITGDYKVEIIREE